MDDVLHGQTPVLVRYIRVVQTRVGQSPRAVLVRRKARKIFNEMGHFVGIRNVFTPITSEEYDAALAMNPEACRPMLSAIGHVRSAEELIENVGRDVLIEETFREMSSSVEGITKLSKLANILRANFEPYVRMAQSILSRAPHLSRPITIQPTPPPDAFDQGLELPPSRCHPVMGAFCTDADFDFGLSPTPLCNSPLCFESVLANQRVRRSVKLRTDPLL